MIQWYSRITQIVAILHDEYFCFYFKYILLQLLLYFYLSEISSDNFYLLYKTQSTTDQNTLRLQAN